MTSHNNGWSWIPISITKKSWSNENHRTFHCHVWSPANLAIDFPHFLAGNATLELREAGLKRLKLASCGVASWRFLSCCCRTTRSASSESLGPALLSTTEEPSSPSSPCNQCAACYLHERWHLGELHIPSGYLNIAMQHDKWRCSWKVICKWEMFNSYVKSPEGTQ